MYIVLTWQALGATPPADVRAEILQEVRDAGLVNTREVFEGQLVANMVKGKGNGVAFTLEESLRDSAPNRFTFTLYYLRRGDVILHSDDLLGPPLVRIADFGA